MRAPNILGSAVALAILLTAPAAAGDPADPTSPEPMPSGHLVLGGDSTLVVPSGRSFILPAGTNLLAPPTWESLDVEMRRLQELETRLTAENQSLRKSADEWRPGWRTLAATLVVGLAGGAYVTWRLQ